MPIVQIIINVILSSAIYLLVALSFTLIYFSTKFFNLTHAIIITSGAYLTFWLFKQLFFPFAVSIAFALILSIGLGIATELFIFRPLRKKSIHSLLLFIASLGLYIILQNIISLLWGDSTKSIRIGGIKVGNEILGAYFTNTQIVIISVSVVLVILIAVFLRFYKMGRQIKAVSSNEGLSNIFGINTNRIVFWSFAIGSAMASVAGILVAYDRNMTPTMGFNLLLYGIVVMIIGGVNSLWGLVWGSLLIALAQNLAAFYISSQWMNGITYIILIIFLIWKPLGFSGKRLKKVDI